MEIPSLETLVAQQSDRPFKGLLCALDPGQTTGYAFFHGHRLLKWGQLETGNVDIATKNLHTLLTVPKPDHVVLEDYKVYANKAKDHINAELVTPQVIGCIRTLCTLSNIHYNKQMASVAKGFCTDEKLKAWNMYAKGQKHARDAIRHGIYFLLFNHQKQGAKK